jgi:hypothetical protein
LTELQGKWIKYIETAYGDNYNPAMLREVERVLPKSEESLRALKDVLLRTVDDKFRKVPGLMAIKAALREVIETYPELSAPPVPLLEDAPADSDTGQWLRLWLDALQADVDPREYEPMREFLKTKGVGGV